ncbi:hypothetical protein ACWDR3_41085 [Streptomyces sp. NPDC001002]
MGKKSKAQHQRDNARARARVEQQRRTAAMEEFTEEHSRVAAQRHGDPRFVQRRRAADGSVEVSWAAGSELDARMQEAMEGQRAAFEEKFGLSPGPDDPVFFDPEADEPRPLPQDALHRVMDEVLEAAERSGLDPAFVHAYRSTAHDGREAEGFTGGDLGEDTSQAAAVETLRGVAAAIMARHDPRVALRVVVGLEQLAQEAGDEAG